MDYREEVVGQLRQLDAMRQAVQSMDAALQFLTPEERLIVQMLYICPEKQAVQKLCPILCVEQAAVYRRKNKALKKLAEALGNKK
jgi:DNA-directed RNA polymerase specialized sigma subunit